MTPVKTTINLSNMFKTLVLYSFFFLFLFNITYCQPHGVIDHIRNDSLRFTILTTGVKIIDSDRVSISTALVRVNLTEKKKRELFKISRQNWIKLLSDTTKDWAANLCLYEIYKKDATVFKSIKTKDQWDKCCRSNDVNYWNQKLK